MNRRNCVAVIDEMIKKIPSEKIKLINALKENAIDASYKAPEETIQWERTQATLVEYIIEPKEDWEFEVLSIFTTKPIEVLKTYF